MSAALINTDLPGLTLLSRGKVRDIYTTSSPDHLLFVATDRISAYDVILRNGIPSKGKLLTQISLFWFSKLAGIIPNHFVTANIDEMPEEVGQYKDQLEGRAMLVKKAEVVPLEAIVRGYLTGSAWAEYKKSGTVHGIVLPTGLVESQKLPEPLFTPSTKAEQGAHDENISPETAAELIGPGLYAQISSAAMELYKTAAAYAETRGLILADTKFEFGLVPSPPPSSLPQVILIDELLTPDSSRYWPLEGYEPGRPQPSFDKQYLRDWLVEAGFRKGLESGKEGEEGSGWVIEEGVVEGTKARIPETPEDCKRHHQSLSLDNIFNSWGVFRVHVHLPPLDPKQCPNLKPDLQVVNLDSFSAARSILKNNPDAEGKVAVLNLASDQRRAGGWEVSLSKTQEEALCYSSTLYETLKPSYYPWPNLGSGSVAGIFSPSIVIFKDDLDNNCVDLSNDERKLVSVITVAAPRLPKLTTDGLAFARQSDLEDLRGKIRLVYRMAGSNGKTSLVLGAMGCGAYRCPPQLVAEEMKSILLEDEFKGWFRYIVLAIYSKKGNGENNFAVFKEVFDKVY